MSALSRLTSATPHSSAAALGSHDTSLPISWGSTACSLAIRFSANRESRELVLLLVLLLLLVGVVLLLVPSSVWYVVLVVSISSMEISTWIVAVGFWHWVAAALSSCVADKTQQILDVVLW